MTDRVVQVVLPAGIDDPARPSGGNVYDRRICEALTEGGWRVVEVPVPGAWPAPVERDLTALADRLAALPDGALVLLDGLVASPSAAVLVPQARRLALVVLVHLPLGVEHAARRAEAAVLHAARAVVATSGWTRDRLLDWYALDPARTTVARPGVDPAPVGVPAADGSGLLCVAPVTRAKGVAVLVEALGRIADLRWTCAVVGRLDLEPGLVGQVRRRAGNLGIGGRLRLVGPLARDDLASAYADAGLVLLPSLLETYGMVVTEALARGVPVVAAEVGGVAEALGGVPAVRPGRLVRAADPDALAGAVRVWLTDDAVRARWRAAALRRRAALEPWASTAAAVDAALVRAAEPDFVAIRPPG